MLPIFFKIHAGHYLLGSVGECWANKASTTQQQVKEEVILLSYSNLLALKFNYTVLSLHLEGVHLLKISLARKLLNKIGMRL